MMNVEVRWLLLPSKVLVFWLFFFSDAFSMGERENA